MNKIIFCFATAFVLGACNSTAPQRTEAGLTIGTENVESVSGSIMFGQICADTYPDFDKARQALAAMPFKQNPNTGTYYHQNVDMSVKLIDNGADHICSMVFGSKDDPDGLAIIFAAASAKAKGNFSFRGTGSAAVQGQPLYQAIITN